MTSLKRMYVSSATVLAVFFAAAGAQAGQPVQATLNGDSPVVEGKSLVDVPYEIVRVTDLNLSHPDGMKTLRGRIKAAVNRVCVDADIKNVREFRASRECRSTAFADAMAQVDTATARTERGAGEVLVAAR